MFDPTEHARLGDAAAVAAAGLEPQPFADAVGKIVYSSDPAGDTERTEAAGTMPAYAQIVNHGVVDTNDPPNASNNVEYDTIKAQASNKLASPVYDTIPANAGSGSVAEPPEPARVPLSELGPTVVSSSAFATGSRRSDRSSGPAGGERAASYLEIELSESESALAALRCWAENLDAVGRTEAERALLRDDVRPGSFCLRKGSGNDVLMVICVRQPSSSHNDVSQVQKPESVNHYRLKRLHRTDSGSQLPGSSAGPGADLLCSAPVELLDVGTHGLQYDSALECIKFLSSTAADCVVKTRLTTPLSPTSIVG